MRTTRLAVLTFLTLWPAGCSSPSATVDLIAQGRRGLALAAEAQTNARQREQEAHDARLAALDQAFDADIRLAAAGAIPDVTLTADWVIEARQGYSAARAALERDAQNAADAYATQMDNLAAADEALDLAATLTVQQWSASEQVKEQFLAIQQAVFPEISETTERSESDE